MNIYTAVFLKQKEYIDIDIQRVIQYQSPKKAITRDDVFRAVADHYGIPVEKLNQHYRKERIVEARYIAWKITKELCGRSATTYSIGGVFDHASVMYGLRVIKDRMDTDYALVERYEKIVKKLKNR